jgi:hypothetical protein
VVGSGTAANVESLEVGPLDLLDASADYIADPQPTPGPGRGKRLMTNVDQRHQLYVAETYKFHREQWHAASQIQSEYGKWLNASLTLIHAGALYGLASNEAFRPFLGRGIIWYFVAGLISSLLSGLAAWVNWGLLAHFSGVYSDPRVIVADEWPTPNPRITSGIRWTYWLSIALGLGSTLCIVLGAWAISCAFGTHG